METKLKVKTRNGQSPIDKAKVYFSCHKDDFEKCFEEITDDILYTQNCAIYYYDPDDTPEEDERFLDLSGIQLFVFPITKKFLMEENQSRCTDLEYAKQSQKAILPLMQEQGLEDTFNSTCGNLHFLDKHQADATAISFEKKLKDFLASVLLSDEQIKQVKEAFDAYIFLSYRKKDRAYAKEIMHLIHQNDFCRDVAIWYDEFLLPGEDFNDAILKAIQKSNLFALAVTPNLNEPNYIQENEYPAAQKSGMPIMPVEVVDTDRDELKKHYKDIPDCTRADNPEAIAKVLSENLKGVALRGKSSPLHNFFIGLAYLAGIDVEPNSQIAVELITDAAEAGLKEAVRKLTNMYRVGDGVSRDYIKQTLWTERLADMLKAEYEEKKDPKIRRDYIKTMETIAKLRLTDGDYNQLIDFGNGFLEAFEDESLTPEEDSMLDNVKLMTAEAMFFNKKYFDAIPIQEKICGKYERLLEDDPKEYAPLLSSCYNHLIALYRETGDGQHLVEVGEKAVNLCLEMMGDDPAVYGSMLASDYANLGGACLAMEDGLQAAEMYFRSAIEIEEVLSQSLDEYLVSLACDCDTLGDICLQQGRNSEAGIYYKKAGDIFKKLRQDNSELYRKEAAVNLNNLGRWHRGQNDLNEAIRCFLEAVELNEVLSQDNPEAFESAVAGVCMGLGDAYTEIGLYGRAKRYIDRAVELGEKYKKPDEPSEWLAEAYIEMGNMYYGWKKPDQCGKYFGMALDILLEAKADKAGGNGNLLHQVYEGLGKHEFGKMNYEGGLAYYKKANEILERLLKKAPGYYTITLVNNYRFLMEVCTGIKAKKDAVKAGLSAIGYYKMRLSFEGIDYDGYLAELMRETGWCYNLAGEKSGARKMLGEAKDILVKLQLQNPFGAYQAKIDEIDAYLKSM